MIATICTMLDYFLVKDIADFGEARNLAGNPPQASGHGLQIKALFVGPPPRNVVQSKQWRRLSLRHPAVSGV